MRNEYLPEMVEVIENKKLSSDTNLIRVNKKIDFKPGQFMLVSCLGIGECPLSICSLANENIEFCVRNVGNLTNTINNLRVKEKIGVRGPYGNGYPLEHFNGKNIVIITGGCGIAPLRAVIRFIIENREKYGDCIIFLGYKTPEEILFKDELDEWKKSFKLYLTVDRGDESWKGHVGVVTKLVDNIKPSRKNSVALICGPPIMIDFTIASLRNLKFENHQIYVSLERLMQCGIGKCGHCLISGRYVCKDGPIFNYAEARLMMD